MKTTLSPEWSSLICLAAVSVGCNEAGPPAAGGPPAAAPGTVGHPRDATPGSAGAG